MGRLSNVPCSLRLSALVRRRALDYQLAAGVDPRSDAALGLRATRLGGRRVRRSIARGLRRTVAAAREARSDRFGFTPLARGEILGEADALMHLIRRLEAPEPVEAMGVALAKQLLSDASSPLAIGAEPGTLHAVVRLATAALVLAPGHNAPVVEDMVGGP